METAMQQMVEEHTEMMRVLTQNMVNRDSKELPPGVQQVLDDHTRIIQRMSQIMTSTAPITTCHERIIVARNQEVRLR
jgi:hypothetical protein